MRVLLLWMLLLLNTALLAQRDRYIVSGPMVGHTELRSAKIWVEFKPEVRNVMVLYREKGTRTEKEVAFVYPGQNPYFNIAYYELNDLKPGTTYTYDLVSEDRQIIATGDITTQTLWQWRGPAPDFSFITGSCAYFNEPPYDRPGRPYGGDSSIFQTMAKEKSAFMLWLGDNWYTREVDYYSEWGLHKRASRDRSMPVLQDLWKAMPHYAIWDDHDYGWNDGDMSYPFKKQSREVFKSFWLNPSYGNNGEGIYSKFTWNDVDVFLLDDRSYRSNDDMADSVNGKPNPEKQMFGKEQITWLKNALLQSKTNANIRFRIIATGSQVLNPASPYDCFRRFPAEYNEFIQFLTDNKINGVVFLTGDRHHSEIIKLNRPGSYPLYDITASPLTSGTHSFGGPEKDNPYRVVGVDKLQNYARISFSGTGINRTLKVEFLGLKGDLINQWSVSWKELSNN